MKFASIRQKTFFTKLSPVVLLAAFLLSPWPVFSEDDKEETHSPISVEVDVTPLQATVGDLITYSIRVRHDSNIEPSAPEFLPPEGLEAVDQGTRELPGKNTQGHKEFWFRLRADLVGSYEFPMLPIPFIVSNADSAGKKIPGQVSSPKAQLEVQSILHLEGEPKDIRDIKPLEIIGRDWLPIVLAVMAVVLVVALGIFLFLKSRKGKSTGPPRNQKNLSPQETALRDLELLTNKGLLEKGQIREYYFELSEIFRRYLGATFNFPALDWTTEEISIFLTSSRSHDAGINEKIGFILENTDLVKFAKAQVKREENMMQEIVNFIQDTSVAEKPEPALNNPAPTS